MIQLGISLFHQKNTNDTFHPNLFICWNFDAQQFLVISEMLSFCEGLAQ